MRKLVLVGALLALTFLGLGYVIGVVRSPSPSLAAGTAPVAVDGRAFVHPFAASWAVGGTTSIPKHADGTVTAISGNTVTIQADHDAGNPNEYTSVTTIQLTGSTQYSGIGGESAIAVGSHILAAGTVSADGKTMTASQIWGGHAGGCPHSRSSPSTTPGAGSSGTNA